MKLITARMIRAKGSCYNPTQLEGVDRKTKWTLLEWMNYKHYKNGADDAIWVFSKMADSKTARQFAIWCAKRCKTDCKEIKEYIKIIEGHYLNGTHTVEDLMAANRAAYWAAYSAAANRAAYWAAYWAAYSAAANMAADMAADSAAYSAADAKKEKKAQLAKIKRMLKEAEK